MDFSIDPGRQQNIQVRTTANDVYSASRNKFSIWLKTIRPNHTSFAGALGDDDVKLFKFHAGKEGFPVEKIIELPAATHISFE